MPTREELERATLKQKSAYSLPLNTANSGYTSEQLKAKFYEGLFYLYDLLSDFRQDIENEDFKTKIENVKTELREVFEAYKGTSDSNYESLATGLAKIISGEAKLPYEEKGAIFTDKLVTPTDSTFITDIEKYGSKLQWEGTYDNRIFQIYTYTNPKNCGYYKFAGDLYPRFEFKKNITSFKFPYVNTNRELIVYGEGISGTENTPLNDFTVARMFKGNRNASNEFATIGQVNQQVSTVQSAIDSFNNGGKYVYGSNIALFDSTQRPFLRDYLTREHIADNLTTEGVDRAVLSARQGKVLKGMIDNINNLLNSDDVNLDSIQEIVNYVKNNQSLIASITSSKVSVSDVVDNLNSDISNKPLSAKQGKVLRNLVNTKVDEGVAELRQAIEQTIEENSINNFAQKVENEWLVNRDLRISGNLVADVIKDTNGNEYARPADIVNKADKNGYYPEMRVGSTDQLESKKPTIDTKPYSFRSVDNTISITDGEARFESIRGNTIVWNQLNTNNSNSESKEGVTFTKNADNSWTVNGTATNEIFKSTCSTFQVIIGHKYLIKGCPNGGSDSTYYLCNGWKISNVDTGNGVIYIPDVTNFQLTIVIANGITCNNLVFTPQIFDLTLMFGKGKEPASVLEFDRMFPNKYYAYDKGTIKNVSFSGFRSVGYNVFNGDVNKYIKVVCGQTYTLEGASGTIVEYDEEKNELSSSTQSTITLSNRTHYVKLTNLSTTENVSFHLTWSGTETGYQPYQVDELSISSSRYFENGMHGVGNVYDELTKTKKIKRFASVDLGTLNWGISNQGTSNEFVRTYDLASTIKITNAPNKANIMCSQYLTTPQTEVREHIMEDIVGINYTTLCIYSTALTGKSSQEIKQALNGVILVYEMAEPIEEEHELLNLHYQVDDYGTEEFLDCEIPVNHVTAYQGNIVDKVDNIIDCVSIPSSAIQTYVNKAFVISFDSNGVSSLSQLPNKPGSGSYVLKCINGTIQWVKE